MFYVSFGAEILYIIRTTTELEKFKSSCAKIISKMTKQGGTITRTTQCLCKMYGQSLEIFKSFSPACLDFLKLLL